MQPWIVVLVFSFASFISGAASAALVGITGGNASPSVLFELDPITGAVIREIGNTGLSHVTGMAFEPSTGDLYLHQNHRLSGGGTLWRYDSTTWAPTRVGTTHIGTPDIAFDASGTLFGRMKSQDGLDPQFNNHDIDRLVMLDPRTGKATQIGNVAPDSHPFQVGLAVDANDRLILKGNVNNNVVTVFEVSKTSGVLNRVVDLSASSNSISVLAFDKNNQAYSVEYKSGAAWLQTLDLTTGAVTNLGSLGAIPISALAFTSNLLPTSITAVPESGSAIWLLTISGIAFVNRRRLAKMNRE